MSEMSVSSSTQMLFLPQPGLDPHVILHDVSQNMHCVVYPNYANWDYTHIEFGVYEKEVAGGWKDVRSNCDVIIHTLCLH